MAKFTDANGLNWHISINLASVYSFKCETGLDIFRMSVGEVPMMTLWELAYSVLKDTAKQRGYTDIKAWLKGIGKTSAMPLCSAVAQEIREFFPEVKEDEGQAENPPPKEDPGNGETSSDSQPKPE